MKLTRQGTDSVTQLPLLITICDTGTAELNGCSLSIHVCLCFVYGVFGKLTQVHM